MRIEEDGEMSNTREITYREAVREAMCEEMRRDENVYFMGEDIGVYCGAFGVSKGMIQEFGEERVRETPISETAFVGAGVGSAITGMRPIVELMFSDFMAVCYDQIINQAAKMHFMFAGKVNVPMVIRTAAGGGTGAAAQHSQSLEQMYCNVPGLKVVVPSTPYDAKGLLKSAIRDNNTVIFLEQKKLYKEKGPVPEEDYVIPLGVASLAREGTDVSVITYGRMVQMSLQVAEKLAAEGISVEVLDLRTLSPLDRDSGLKRLDFLVARTQGPVYEVLYFANKLFSLLLGVVMVVAFAAQYPYVSTRTYSTFPIPVPYTVQYFPMCLAGAYMALESLRQMAEHVAEKARGSRAQV